MDISLPIIGSDDVCRIAPTKIIAVGLNYRSHIAESQSVKIRGMDGDVPPEPVLFSKTPNVLIPDGAPIPIPSILREYPWKEEARTDYEGELVAVMGRRGKDIPAGKALDYVFGCTCGNDVSQRNMQRSDRSGWFRGKSFDGFGPVGPAIARIGDLDGAGDLAVVTRLNGEMVQESRTSLMIFPLAELVSFISRHVTLEEGDLIFTGTPAGVGPIAAGDLVEVEIEGIGTLRNPVIDAGGESGS
jgi:2-keto-4-pentenoate hydratase/2-oxohepta-3-ene-1,7-dioic acid hydratase in catechol pathway